jgi:hypothetical protein
MKGVLEMALNGKIKVDVSPTGKHHINYYPTVGAVVNLAVRGSMTSANKEVRRLGNLVRGSSMFQGVRDSGVGVC